MGQKIKKVRTKKLIKSNKSISQKYFFGIFSFKLFLSSKIDFWLFLKLQKMDFIVKKIFFVTLI